MFLTSLLLLAAISGSTTELSGRVVDQQSKPIAGAIVVISTAKPRVGPATICPSCYPDCTKRTLTDADGNFHFDKLSSLLSFSLAAGGVNHQGMISPYFDPAAKPEIELKLPSLPERKEGDRISIAAGIVVDEQGDPVPAVEVRSQLIGRDNGVFGGEDSSVTPLTLTDSDGNFQATAGPHIRSVVFRFERAGYAPQELTWERGNTEPLRVELGRGASIRGRLMLEEKPLVGVELEIVQKNRWVGNICTPAVVSTDADGYFQFDQLPPKLDYAVYTIVGQDAKGAFPVSLIDAPEHGQLADFGDLSATQPFDLTLKVRTEDGFKLPQKSVVFLGRRDAWQTKIWTLPEKPEAVVQANDVGSEAFNITVRVPGYSVSSTNPPLNLGRNGEYQFRVAADTELEFVLVKDDGKPGK